MTPSEAVLMDELLERGVSASDATAALEVARNSRGECPHDRLIVAAADERFESRAGCLRCDKWLQPVRLQRRP